MTEIVDHWFSLLLQSLGRRRRRRAKPKGVLLVRRDAGGKFSRQPRAEHPHFSWLTHSTLLKQRPPATRPHHSLPPHSTPLQTDRHRTEEKRGESEHIQIPRRKVEHCIKFEVPNCHLPPDNKVALSSKTVESSECEEEGKRDWKGGGEGGGGGGERQEKKGEEYGEESSEHQLTDTEAWIPADSLTLHHLVKVEGTTRIAAGRVEDTSQVEDTTRGVEIAAGRVEDTSLR